MLSRHRAVTRASLAALSFTLLIAFSQQATTQAGPEPDPLAPESLLPQNVGIAIATDASITIPFESSMDAASVEAALHVLPQEPVELAWDEKRTELTISPERRWRNDANYLVIVGQSSATADGTQLRAGRRFSFTTATAPAVTEFQVNLAGADLVAAEQSSRAEAPSVRTLSLEGATETPVVDPGSHAPTETAREVSATTSISIRFSAEMDRADVEDHFTITPSVAGRLTWEGSQLVFTPTERLLSGGRYTISLIGAHAADGTLLGGKANFSFVVTTGAQLTRTEPTDGATDAEPATVEMWFSRPMDVEATNEAFGLTDGASGALVGGRLVWNEAGTLLTYTPDQPFAGGRQFTVAIGDGARDADGNEFSTSWSFTTAATLTAAGDAASRTDMSTRDAVQIPAPAPASDLVEYALNQINAAREAYGFAPLVLDGAITEVATAHAWDQVTNGYYSHTSLNGMSLYQRLSAGGVGFGAASENQCHYYGQSAGATLDWCHSAFMAEPYPGEWNHIANILNPQWTRVGVGIGDNGSHVVITWDFTN